jgi:hypothetical protein
MLVIVRSKTPAPVAPMRFTSKLTPSIAFSHYSDLADPKGENGETPALPETLTNLSY